MMREFLLLSILGLFVFQCSALANVKKYKPGSYHCPYYMHGKTNDCVIDVDIFGKATTTCSYLDFKNIKILLNSDKCSFKSHKYWGCRFPANRHKEYNICIVEQSPTTEQYTTTCEAILKSRAINEVKRKTKNCESVPPSEIEKYYDPAN